MAHVQNAIRLRGESGHHLQETAGGRGGGRHYAGKARDDTQLRASRRREAVKQMRRECGKVSDKAETIVRFLQCTKTVAFGPVRHSILIDVVTMRAKGKGDKEGTKADHGEHRQKGMSQTRLKLLLGSCSAPKRLPLDLCVIVSSLTFHSKVE